MNPHQIDVIGTFQKAKPMTKFLSTLTALSLTMTAANAAGYRMEMLPVDHRDRDIEVHIWYPSADDTTAETIGKNAVFKGSQVYPNATPASGAHPLVVLSHGSGGNAANLSWIAADLADRGMIVMAPNHPGTTSRDSYPDQTVKIWDRPADLSAIIEHATKTMQITDQIASLGFSLGGYTSLGIAGARVLKQDYIDYCAEFSGMMDCGWLTQGGVDFTQIDQTRYEQSNRDPRITAVVSIDPALSQAFDHSSLGDISIPVQLINLGQRDAIPAAIDAANLTQSFPLAEHHYIDQATHFSFLGDCTTMGKVIIMAAGEDPICSEVGNRKRTDIHAELQATIGAFLTEHLID